MIRKKRGITAGKQYVLGLIAAVGVVSALWCQSFVSLADSTGTITASSATLRAETNTNSTALGSVAGGTTVTIVDEVQDSSGTLWYQVSVNGQTGYIRSDLMSKTEGGADSQGNAGQTPPGATVAPDTVLDAQYAVVSSDTIKVRTAPSTDVSIVDNLNRNDQVIVSGETQGTDGKTWYYVTFTGTVGSERSGFIRSDLLSLGEMVPVPEDVEVPEVQESEPEPEIPVNDDYELHYDQTDDGSYAYYIYDYADPEHPGQILKYPLEELMQVTKARSVSSAADAKTLVRQRVAIIALIVLAALLIGVIVIMALKLRDIYSEDDGDEDEEEEEAEEETPARRRRLAWDDEETDTQRRRRTQDTKETPARHKRRAQEIEETPTQRRRRTEDSERGMERPARRRPAKEERETRNREVEYHEDEAGSAPVRTAKKRKPKNFLVDDDEFEFEFLNMDDKG